MKALFALVVLSVVACTDITSPTPMASSLRVANPRAETLVNDKTPFTAVFWNDCSGETVVVEGETHYLTKVSTSTSGAVKISIANDTHFSGYGTTTGAKYEGSFKTPEKDAFSSDAFSYWVSNTVKINGQGKIPDYYLDISTKFSIRSNGVVRDSETFTTHCK